MLFRSHDDLVQYKLMKTLMDMGVEVSRSQREFVADGVVYPRGTYVVFAGQHCRPYVVSLLKRTYYHLGPFSRYDDGTPVVPYDLSTYTIAEFMGIRTHEVEKPFEGSFEVLSSIRYPRGDVADDAANGWLLDGKVNDGFLAVNRLLRRGYAVQRISEAVEVDGKTLGAGSFYIPKAEGVEVELGDRKSVV